MSESLAARVKRIISGSLHNTVDCLESANAETVMREAIREVDRVAHDVRVRIGDVSSENRQVSRQLDHLRKKVNDLYGKIDFAVNEGRDELASAAIARQMDLEGQIKLLEQSAAELRGQIVELESYVAALNGRRNEMENEFRVFLNDKAMRSDQPSGAGQASSDSTETAEEAFARALNGPFGTKASSAEQRAETQMLSDIENLQRKSEIERRLARAKAMRQAS